MRNTTWGTVLLLALLVGVTAPQAAADDEEVVRGELGRKIDRAVQRTSGGGFWGVVLVAKDGEVLLAKGYGFADYGTRPNTPDTLFEIASTSKQFTAAAILRLRLEGRLRLSDPITRFFRDVPEDKRGITVHHLLTHTSGIGGNVGVPYASPLTRDEFVRHVFSRPLSAAPGERFAYCNACYALLAAIVEETSSGTSFEAYSKRHLFRRAGLVDAGFVQDPDLDKKRVTARLSDTMPDATAIDWYWSWGYRGMGGVVTTAYDLLRWDRALCGDDVLDEEAKKVFYTPHHGDYACGWKVARTPRGTTKVHHSGGVMGYAAQYVRYLEDDAVIVILSNGKSDIFGIEKRIDGLLFPAPAIEVSLDVRPYDLNRYRGAELPDTVRWRVRREGDRVVLTLEDRAREHPAAVIRAPVGVATKLAHDLAALLRGRGEDPEQTEGMDAGVYLNPYPDAGKRLELSEGLEPSFMPQYRGRGEDGQAIIDSRITFILVDARRRHWPVMAKMDDSIARDLLKALEKAVGR